MCARRASAPAFGPGACRFRTQFAANQLGRTSTSPVMGIPIREREPPSLAKAKSKAVPFKNNYIQVRCSDQVRTVCLLSLLLRTVCLLSPSPQKASAVQKSSAVRRRSTGVQREGSARGSTGFVSVSECVGAGPPRAPSARCLQQFYVPVTEPGAPCANAHLSIIGRSYTAWRGADDSHQGALSFPNAGAGTFILNPFLSSLSAALRKWSGVIGIVVAGVLPKDPAGKLQVGSDVFVPREKAEA